MKAVKRGILAAITILVFVMGISFPSAASGGRVILEVSSTNVGIDDTITVTATAYDSNRQKVTANLAFSFNTSKFSFVSCNVSGANAAGGTVTVTAGRASITLKAIDSGSSAVSASASVSGNSLTAAGVNIGISEEKKIDETKSADNSLKSLKLTKGSISPEFQYSVTKYTAEVGADVDRVDVIAETSHKKAKVTSVIGNENLQLGENTVTVTITAENGSEAVYKIIVTKNETTETNNEDTDSTENVEEKKDNVSDDVEEEVDEKDSQLSQKEQMTYLQKNYDKLYEKYQNLLKKNRITFFSAIIIIVILLIVIINLIIFGRMKKDRDLNEEDEEFDGDIFKEDVHRIIREEKTKKSDEYLTAFAKNSEELEKRENQDEELEILDLDDL
ncbi:MAG: cadherin-like beta sandwich domain-containing protein [Lachnospiraceae bacterium]